MPDCRPFRVSSRCPGRRHRWDFHRTLPLLLLLSPGCTLTPRGLDLSYIVDLRPGGPDIPVTVILSGIASPALDLVGSAAQSVLKVTGLNAVDDRGGPVQVATGVDSVAFGGSKICAPHVHLSGISAGRATLAYKVSLGTREGNAHFGFTGRAFSCKTPTFGFATGRQLFLIPEARIPVRSIVVRFLTAPTCQVAAPWARERDSWTVGVRGADPRDHLVSAAIAWGRLEEKAVVVGGTTLHLVYPVAANDKPNEDDLRNVRKCAAFVHDLFRRDLGRDYLVVMADCTPDLDDLEGEAWGTGQGGTLLPVTPRTLRIFARRLIDAYVLYPPYAARIRDPKEYWLLHAVEGWYPSRAVEAAGLTDQAQIDCDLADAYYSAFDVPGVPRNLEALYGTAEANSIAAAAIAPVVLRYLDWKLRNGHHLLGVDSLVPSLFDPRAPKSLWEALGRWGGAWHSFRRDYVQGSDNVPVSNLVPANATKPGPQAPNRPTLHHLTLVYTGDTGGFLETCGCKVNQSGGVARRATVLREIRAADPSAVVLDAGNSFPSALQPYAPDSLAAWEQKFYLRMFDEMGYCGSALGSTDLARGHGYLSSQLRGIHTPFLGGNVRFATGESPIPYIRLTARGVRIGVIGALEAPNGDDRSPALDRGLRGVEIDDPAAALQRILPEVQSRVDLVIVIGELRPVTIRKLIDRFPQIGVFISTEDQLPVGNWDAGHDRVTVQRTDRSGFLGTTLVLYANLKQYGLNRANLSLDARLRVTGADVNDIWLRQDVPDDPVVRGELNRFYRRMAAHDGVGSQVHGPLAWISWRTGRTYVGAARCRDCHASEYAQWRTTPHASAYKTLLERHRQVQPRCVSCHVVGYGQPTGFHFGDQEVPLGNVQCEVCHGPGGDHSRNPVTSNIVRSVPQELCVSCHNEEHSGSFVYAARIRMVEHSLEGGGQEALSNR